MPRRMGQKPHGAEAPRIMALQPGRWRSAAELGLRRTWSWTPALGNPANPPRLRVLVPRALQVCH